MSSPEVEKENYKAETLKLLFESQERWFWQTIELLSKFVTYYLAIVAVVLGYVFTAGVSLQLQRLVLIIGILASIFFIIEYLMCIWGLFYCLTSMDKVTKELDPDVYTGLDIKRNFITSKKILRIVMICSASILISIPFGMAYLLAILKSN
jgi:hypothetical protein